MKRSFQAILHIDLDYSITNKINLFTNTKVINWFRDTQFRRIYFFNYNAMLFLTSVLQNIKIQIIIVIRWQPNILSTDFSFLVKKATNWSWCYMEATETGGYSHWLVKLRWLHRATKVFNEGRTWTKTRVPPEHHAIGLKNQQNILVWD